jgi:hypothetical protein
VTVEYLDSLTAALSFDRKLARRVRKEFEDHLAEAVAADPGADRVEAERRAVAICGDPRAIAAELAVTALAQRTKRLAVGLVLALLGVLLAMKGHVAWYTAMQWGVPDAMRSVATALGAVARYTFLTAIFVGTAGWAYASRRRLPSDYLHGKYSGHLTRFCLLSGVATAALVVCILVDAALATIRLYPISPSLAFSVPIGSISFEIACAGALIILIRALVRQVGCTARLQQIDP